jgi:hypothetical protein
MDQHPISCLDLRQMTERVFSRQERNGNGRGFLNTQRIRLQHRVGRWYDHMRAEAPNRHRHDRIAHPQIFDALPDRTHDAHALAP